MRIPAATSSCVSALLDGELQSAGWLGACDRALYLITESSSVLAVLTHDAIRLPCGIVLSATAAELSLTTLAPPASHRHQAGAVVGGGRLEWTGPAGPIRIDSVRRWAPPRLPTGSVDPIALAELVRTSTGRDLGIQPAYLAALRLAGRDQDAQTAAALDLLGRGPGLTPSGDDVLAGLLIGARTLGVGVAGVARVVGETAGQATTALSAQLLRHAARGECVDQLAAASAALIGLPAAASAAPTAFQRLVEVGHTSGAALAQGLLVAAELVPSVVNTGGLQ
jgi:hypothetical protein